MEPHHLIQGSAEWHAARCGSLGASQIAEMMARTKSGGWGASRDNLRARLVAERLTGIPADTYTNSAMVWGQETEAEARAYYSFIAGVEVMEVGLIRHPRISGTHASPDGTIADDGLIEIKCPGSSAHISTLLGGKVPEKYVLQMQWQMACTGRAWCDFVSYDPRLPDEMRLFVARIERDDERIKTMEEMVEAFLAEVDETVAALSKRYGVTPPAGTMTLKERLAAEPALYLDAG